MRNPAIDNRMYLGSFCYRELGHDGPINAAEGLPALYRRILSEAISARLAGEWDGECDFDGWNIPRVQQIIKENGYENKKEWER